MRHIVLLACFLCAYTPQVFGEDFPLPEFTGTHAEHWLNSAPLTTQNLRGKVVLLEFWTFGCSNCYRSIPWLKSAEAKYGNRTFAVVGIHTPEFAHEKLRGNIEKSLRAFKITYPVMIDNDHAYWNLMRNRYWPTFYLIDKEGIVRGVFIGETHAGDGQAQAIERQIEDLITR